FAKMNAGCVILACTLLVGASSGSKAGQPLKPPCRPGFSQNFYTVIVSRDLLHGQSILKGKLFHIFFSFFLTHCNLHHCYSYLWVTAQQQCTISLPLP
uniref:Cadherin N-terminal domain-containing protein n=1 Tax=Neolamprologus brichardi TaxID=32507 RepID=A0A3Q4IE87_NEOBR